MQDGALETWLDASMSHWRPVVVSASFRSSAPLAGAVSSFASSSGSQGGRVAFQERPRQLEVLPQRFFNVLGLDFKVVLPSGKCEISAMQENGSASADSWWSGRASCFTGDSSRPDRHVALDSLGALQRPL